MNILIVEDDTNKLNALEDFLKDYFEKKNLSFNLDIKQSYQSGLEAILNNNYDLLLLDMSLPNFDTDEHGENGAPLSRGGELILYEMDMEESELATIIITQHDDFGGESLETISDDYKEKFSAFYIDHVFYNSIESNWEIELEILLDGVIND